MHCYACYRCVFLAINVSSYVYVFNYGYLSSGHYVYVSKDVRIHAYFSNSKGFGEENNLENTGLYVVVVQKHDVK